MSTAPAPEPQKLTALKSLLTDGMAIAAATAFAYFSSFVYESGYCSHFAIPLSLINPNTATILLAVFAIGAIFISSANLLGLTTPLFRRAKKSKDNPLWLLAGVTLVALIVFHKIYDFTWRQFGWIAAGIFALVVFFVLGTTVFVLFEVWRSRRTARKAAKNNAMPSSPASATVAPSAKANEESERSWLSIDEFLEIFLPPKAVRFFLLAVGVLMTAWLVGNGNATNQKKYLTLRDSPNHVVLRIYGDMMITATFNRETREVSDELSILWLGEKKQMNFVNEDIGPLQLQRPPKLSR